MKRTQERWNLPQADLNTNGLSGCIQFEGEDLTSNSRKKHFQGKQKEWLDEQVRQKRQFATSKQDKENQYSEYVKQITELRGTLESQFYSVKNTNQMNMKEFNQRMALQKKIENENQTREKYLQEKNRIKQLEEIHRERDYTPLQEQKTN